MEIVLKIGNKKKNNSILNIPSIFLLPFFKGYNYFIHPLKKEERSVDPKCFESRHVFLIKKTSHGGRICWMRTRTAKKKWKPLRNFADAVIHS